MARTSTYINFSRNTEDAFNFYRRVFGTEFLGEISRWDQVPADEGMPPLPEEDKNLVMHIALPILGGHVLMGSDVPESMGLSLNVGDNVVINLEPDTKDETDRLFTALSEGGTVTMPLEMAFWGGYFGAFTDKFGVNWMVNCEE